MFDYAIIGGGVVGCAIFDALTLAGKKCVLLEKENDVALGCSKANSGLSHAGFDAKEGTLKARLNVRGHFLLPKVAKRLGIKYVECGAIVVGDDKQKVRELFERGKRNGVKKLKIINQKQIQKLCPNLKHSTCALFAPTAGLVSPYNLTIALAEEALINGGEIKFCQNITKIEKKGAFFVHSDKIIEAKCIINAAGFGFNEVSKLVGGEIFDLKFRKGEYYVLDKSQTPFVNLSVFPLPTRLGKGILATPTIDGNVLLGPTAEDNENTTQTSGEGLEKIRESIKEMFGVFPAREAIREFAGVRCFCGDDFIIEKSKLVDGLINVAGICSPGLTSAVAIGEYVLDMLGEKGKIKSKRRPLQICMRDLSTRKKNKIIKQNPDFGKIVCRCENVSLGEIKQAISSPLKPTTVDAIKRRVRAGMGRCQGGFCQSRVLQALSSECGIDMREVKKEYANSNVVPYEVKEVDNEI